MCLFELPSPLLTWSQLHASTTEVMSVQLKTEQTVSCRGFPLSTVGCRVSLKQCNKHQVDLSFSQREASQWDCEEIKTSEGNPWFQQKRNQRRSCFLKTEWLHSLFLCRGHSDDKHSVGLWHTQTHGRTLYPHVYQSYYCYRFTSKDTFVDMDGSSIPIKKILCFICRSSCALEFKCIQVCIFDICSMFICTLYLECIKVCFLFL